MADQPDTRPIVTITPMFETVALSFPVGKLYSTATERRPGDVCLSRIANLDLPLKLVILIYDDGTIHEWYTEWDPYACSQSGGNTYWHFDHGSDTYTATHPPTQAQRVTIAKLFFGAVRPYGLRGGAGVPVQAWCQYADTKEFERLGNEGRPGLYA